MGTITTTEKLGNVTFRYKDDGLPLPWYVLINHKIKDVEMQAMLDGTPLHGWSVLKTLRMREKHEAFLKDRESVRTRLTLETRTHFEEDQIRQAVYDLLDSQEFERTDVRTKPSICYVEEMDWKNSTLVKVRSRVVWFDNVNITLESPGDDFLYLLNKRRCEPIPEFMEDDFERLFETRD